MSLIIIVVVIRSKDLAIMDLDIRCVSQIGRADPHAPYQEEVQSMPPFIPEMNVETYMEILEFLPNLCIEDLESFLILRAEVLAGTWRRANQLNGTHPYSSVLKLSSAIASAKDKYSKVVTGCIERSKNIMEQVRNEKEELADQLSNVSDVTDSDALRRQLVSISNAKISLHAKIQNAISDLTSKVSYAIALCQNVLRMQSKELQVLISVLVNARSTYQAMVDEAMTTAKQYLENKREEYLKRIQKDFDSLISGYRDSNDVNLCTRMAAWERQHAVFAAARAKGQQQNADLQAILSQKVHQHAKDIMLYSLRNMGAGEGLKDSDYNLLAEQRKGNRTMLQRQSRIILQLENTLSMRKARYENEKTRIRSMKDTIGKEANQLNVRMEELKTKTASFLSLHHAEFRALVRLKCSELENLHCRLTRAEDIMNTFLSKRDEDACQMESRRDQEQEASSTIQPAAVTTTKPDDTISEQKPDSQNSPMRMLDASLRAENSVQKDRHGCIPTQEAFWARKAHDLLDACRKRELESILGVLKRELCLEC